MTLLMAEKDQQPMFRDFLGLNHHMGEAQPPPAEFPSSDVLRVSSSGGGPSLKVEVDPETSAAAPPTASRGKLGPSETRHSPDFVSTPFGLALPSSSEQGATISLYFCFLWFRAFPSSLFWLWRQKTDSGHGWFFLPPLQCVGSRARQEHFSTMGSRVHSTSQLWMAANWQKRESLLVAESHCRIA